jgi:hypothetical protein
MFPDVEKTLVSYLSGQLANTRVCTETPADMLSVLPVVQVQRVSGADDGFRLDSPAVDVSVYASTRDDASSVSQTILGLFSGDLRGKVVGTAVVTGVKTIAGPRWLPYDDTNVRRYQASYQVFIHSA